MKSLRIGSLAAMAALAFANGCGSSAVYKVECQNPSGTATLTWPDGGKWNYTLDTCSVSHGNGEIEPLFLGVSPDATAAFAASGSLYLNSQFNFLMGIDETTTAPDTLTTANYTGDIPYNEEVPKSGTVAVGYSDYSVTDGGKGDFQSLDHELTVGQPITLQSFGFPDQAQGSATLHIVASGVKAADGSTFDFEGTAQLVSVDLCAEYAQSEAKYATDSTCQNYGKSESDIESACNDYVKNTVVPANCLARYDDYESCVTEYDQCVADPCTDPCSDYWHLVEKCLGTSTCK